MGFHFCSANLKYDRQDLPSDDLANCYNSEDYYFVLQHLSCLPATNMQKEFWKCNLKDPEKVEYLQTI